MAVLVVNEEKVPGDPVWLCMKDFWDATDGHHVLGGPG